MSNHWNSGHFQQGLPADSGKVKMFDPTHFQTQTPFTRTSPGKSVLEPKPQNDGTAHPQPLPHPSHSSWDSWGGWSFDGSNNQHQETDSVMTPSQNDERAADNSYYGGEWNQSWNGAGHPEHQPQGYTHSSTPAGYNETQQQHHAGHGFQPYGSVSFNQSQDSSSDPPQVPQSDPFFGDQFYNPVQQEIGDQRQSYNHDHDQSYNHDHDQVYNQEHNQVYNQEHGLDYNHEHGHVFNQANNQNQHYYDQPHDGGVWTANDESGQWTTHSQQEFPLPDVAEQEIPQLEVAGNDQELNNSTDVVSENLPQAINDFSSKSVGELPGPSVQVFDNDDDGTVSGHSGRDGDGDGDVQFDTQRHGHDGDQNGENSLSVGNQYLSVAPQFHRANSEISNASLSTLNLSVSEDDDGHEPLHNIQELVQRMEEVDLARRQGDGNIKNTDNPENRISVDNFRSGAVEDPFSDTQSKQKRGDYSGFGNSADNQAVLPLDKNIRPSSPIGDHPDSAGSGGSSSLTDWEIVSPQTRQTSHNRNSSLDNNVLLFADKPDGGDSPSRAYQQPVFGGSALDQLSHPGSQIPHPPGDPSLSNTSSAPPEPSDHHRDTRGRSGSPFVAAFTDHRQEESLPQPTQIPPPASTVPSSTITSNTVLLFPEVGPTFLPKRDVAKGQNSQHPLNLSSSSNLSSLPDFKQAVSSEVRSQGLTGATLKHKVSTDSLTDDGDCTSKGGADRSGKRERDRSGKGDRDRSGKGDRDWSGKRDSDLSGKGDRDLSGKGDSDRASREDSDRSGKRDRDRSGKRDSDRASREDSDRASRGDSDRSDKGDSDRASRGDTNRTNKRDADTATKAAEMVSTQNKEEPPVRSSSRNSEEMSGQQWRHHSAFHAVNRPRQSAMSPATTLWDNSETPAYNLLLAPAMPLIIPNLNTNPVSVDTPATFSVPEVSSTQKAGAGVNRSVVASRSKEQNTTARLSVGIKDTEKREALSRNKEASRRESKNRSYDSLDEVDAVPDDQRNRSYDSQQSDLRESSYSQDSYRQNMSRREPDRPTSRADRPSSRADRPSSRNDRPSSRSDRSGQYHYDRPANKTEDPSRRHYGYYRDYGNVSYDERYDRPRSRQDESHTSRPSSRAVHEADRPRSRTGYEQERDYYYKDRQKAYGYDNYGRHADYYDERERYYRYYKEKEARYSRGYYDEYYGAKPADYYYQVQQGQQPSIQESGQSSRNQSRGSTPAMAPSPAIPPSSGVKPSSGHSYYGNTSSRPDSRTDYNRDYYNRGYAYDGYNAFYDGGYGYDPYAYGYTYPTYDEYSQGYNQGRMTPPKHSYPHTHASFGPAGQLLKVLPNQPASGQPAVVVLQDVQAVLESCPEADELKRFPGPLSRAHSHKKDVLIYCQQKAKSCGENINMVDRESAQLVWKFLELLIKQNGSVVGTDLADLLLEGHEPSTHEYNARGVKISQSPEVLDSVPEGNSEEGGSRLASPAVRVTMDRTAINSSVAEREKWVDRFRYLLLHGHKKDALECAMKYNLWGHALFLASKMDARTHANVMARFANGAIQMNDPLQTLYQLMSGRPPAAVTCVVDDRWGDWRPHLAMILSNQTSRPDIDRKSIATLGDTLAAKGCLHASHFCYLMAHVVFGSYNRKTSKIVLIGSDHNLPVDEFATNEAVQCTEVYEYAQSLGDPAFYLPHFQVFKYLYACRLADYGMPLEALQYCEMIANNINLHPSSFHSPFVKLVHQLASKLKFCDPQRQLAGEDVDDSMWLQHLEKICFSYDDGSVHPLSGTATPAGYPGTTTSSESGDYSSYGNGYRGDATTPSTMSSAPVVGTYGHQVNHADSTAYSYGQHDVAGDAGQVHNPNSASADQQADYSQQQYDYSQWQQTYGYHYTNHGEQQQQQLDVDQATEHHQHHEFTQPPASHPPARDDVAGSVDEPGHSYPPGAGLHPDLGSQHGGQLQLDSSSTHPASSPPHLQLDSSSASTHPASSPPHPTTQDYGNFDAVQHRQHHEPPANQGPPNDRVDAVDGPTSGFDYFGNVGAQKIVAPSHRYRHLSGSSVGSTGRRRTISGGSSSNMPATRKPPQPTQQQSAGGKGFDSVTNNGPQGAPGNGWFGGLLNKFKVKGKNEMILPDDKNPAIVWDPVKKKWTNADGTEDESAAAAPPPKDADLIGKPLGTPPSISSGPPPPSMPPGGNRFSLKAKGARNQYVDVTTNPKAVSVPQHLFNVMPGSTAPTSGGLNLFLPGSGPVPGEAAAETPNLDSGSLTIPNSTDKLSRSSSLSSLSREIQQFTAKQMADNPDTSPNYMTTPSMPMLFNPSSLKSGQAASTPAPKFGQRRTYPK